MSRRAANVCRRVWTVVLFGLAAGWSWSATVTLQTTRLGDTPALLAYNSGHFVPGSNTRDWWRYSGVSGARVFLTPGLIEAQDDLPGWGDGVVDRASFLARRAALRADPLNPAFINWNYLTNRYRLTAQHGSNILEPFHACATLRALGIALLVNLGADPGTFPITSADDWAGKWELWQHYYFEAFFLGREFDAERFQMWNEPDASGGPALADYLERLKLVSDAVQCALADVNRLYGKTLSPRILAPVTAGNTSSDYTGWGRPIVTNRHVNFLGETDPTFQLIHQYDYHEYNPPVSTFASHLRALHGWLEADMAPEPRWPTSISEFNAHTAAVFASMPDTLDTPSKFTRLAAIAATLATNDCRELYCFKFSQTLYNSTVPIKKNGTHFVDNTNAPYNIGGITRGGEVWRLFNKAAAPGRERLAVQTGGAPGVFLATRDPRSETHWLFSANDTVGAEVQLDAVFLGLPPGQRVLLEEISEARAGVRELLSVVGNRIAAGTQALNSVWLFTLPAPPQAPLLTLPAAGDATVQDGAARTANFGATNRCWVRNHSSDPGQRAAALVKFSLPRLHPPDVQFALLTLRVSSLDGATNAQAHVYALTNHAWSEHSVTWSNAPNLAQNRAAGLSITNNVVLGAGESARFAGQLFAGPAPQDYTLDVTEFVRGNARAGLPPCGPTLSFLIVREIRFHGDVPDADGLQFVSREGDPAAAPRLVLARNLDSDGDGIGDESELNEFGTDPRNADTDGDGAPDGEEILEARTDPGRATNIAPYLVVQPAGQTVASNGVAVFHTRALGSAPLRFQWFFNSTPIRDATNAMLVLENAQPAHAGVYFATVSNTFGGTASAPATLTVLLPPPSGLPIHEPFDYEPGTLAAGQGGWVLNGGSSGVIEAGSLDVVGLAAPRGQKLAWGAPSMSLRLPLGTNLTQGDVYFSFALRVDELGPNFTGEGTLAGFTTGTGTSFGTKVNIRTNGSGQFQLGVSKSTGTTYGAWANARFQTGETIFVVGRYRFRNGSGTDDTCDLWLNPDPTTFGLAAPPPATLADLGGGGNDLAQIDRFFFRSGGSSSSPAKLVADELRVGRGWAEVTTPLRPALRAEREGAAIRLRWTTNAPGFALETADSLPPDAWTPVQSDIRREGADFAGSVPITNAKQFFRLRR